VSTRGVAVLGLMIVAACLSMPPRPGDDPPGVDAPRGSGSGSGFDASVEALASEPPAELAATLAATGVRSVVRY